MRYFLLLISLIHASRACTITRVSGTQAPAPGFCAGDLIFEDNFNNIDRNRWFYENTLAGGGNWEFQWYHPDPTNRNLRVINGSVHFIPTLTSDEFGVDFVTNGWAVIPPNECTQAQWYGCERRAQPPNSIINPTRSVRIDTRQSFSFRYGEMEIRAKIPGGDWLWPALWLLPTHDVYGGWPRSGEIDLMEARSNLNLMDGATHVGSEQVGSTMHFGPRSDFNGWPTAHYTRNQRPAFHTGFHRYRVRWTDSYIQFFVDDVPIGTVNAGTGFWDRGGFHNSGFENPWTGGTIMAPFDQDFYIIMNLAVGGTVFFPDHWQNSPFPKPWSNQSPRAAADFWEHRHQWLPSWNVESDQSHMVVDYVRVWAI